MVTKVRNGERGSKLELTDALYIPGIGYTLISIGKIDDAGYTTTFGGGKCVIRDSEGEVVGV
jgi:hypothetical protein